MPEATLQETSTSEIHSDASHAVPERRTCRDESYIPTDRPVMDVSLRVGELVLFEPSVPSASVGASNEYASVPVPARIPAVTARKEVPRSPIISLQESSESDIHRVISHAEPAERAESDASNVPRDDVFTMISTPPCPGKLEPSTSHTAQTIGASYDMRSVVVPTSSPDVTMTGSVLANPRGIKHTSPVSLPHSVASACVHPALARRQYCSIPKPDPEMEKLALPRTAWFAGTTRVMDGRS
mmetsp:Transcript_20444/g.49497  ORF Transcript_20444/g.49497 Transcript_20444/m.49497 type:complete len:241 (+) Transcript_20444:1316-2038(+)